MNHLAQLEPLMFCTRWICRRKIASAVLLIASFSTLIANADEVIIEEGSSLKSVACGDYACSPCVTRLGSAFVFDNQGNGPTIEMTAGELWQYFDQQGFSSVNKLSLFMDIERLESESQFNLSKLNVQIHSADGVLLTDAKLGDGGLVVPGYETSATRPEAQLSLDLGYDFMELFHKESTAIVRVSMESPYESATPTFLLTADDNMLGRTNLGNMFFFVLFWGVVFLITLRWMKPVRNNDLNVRSARPANGSVALAARRSA